MGSFYDTKWAKGISFWTSLASFVAGVILPFAIPTLSSEPPAFSLAISGGLLIGAIAGAVRVMYLHNHHTETARQSKTAPYTPRRRWWNLISHLCVVFAALAAQVLIAFVSDAELASWFLWTNRAHGLYIDFYGMVQFVYWAFVVITAYSIVLALFWASLKRFTYRS